jgi:hypothetical protein
VIEDLTAARIIAPPAILTATFSTSITDSDCTFASREATELNCGPSFAMAARKSEISYPD